MKPSLANDRKRAAADAANHDAQQDISIDLDRIADIKLYAGDSCRARSRPMRRAWASGARLVAGRSRKRRAAAGAIGESRQDQRREAGRGRRHGRARRLRARARHRPPPRRVDPGNTELQRDVAIGLERLGGLKLAAGDFAAALAAYEEGLVVRRRLAKIDEGNTLWQRDVAIGLGEIADVKIARSDLGRGAGGVRRKPRYPPPLGRLGQGQRRVAA